jgi:translation initiation factor IF-1
MSAEGYNAPGAMKAVVIKLAGSVKIKNRGSITWHDAKMNEVLTAGDTIETKDKGKIEIRLENGNVVTLQQNSNLILEKLSSDNKTGDYENLLESKSGKLRAQVQKIKGNSKFEIKTPNAVACVRGTIMYLNILPNLTNSYFEEGNGVLRSLISNTVKDVPLGTGASADNAGNVSDPTPPNDNQMSEWHQGWDVSDSGEGYSSPSGDLGQDRGSDEGDDTGSKIKYLMKNRSRKS